MSTLLFGTRFYVCINQVTGGLLYIEYQPCIVGILITHLCMTGLACLQVNTGDVLQHWKNGILKPLLAKVVRVLYWGSKRSFFALW